MRRLIYAFVLLALPHPAAAQNVTECHLKADQRLRLACYDALYPPNAPQQEGPENTLQFSYSWAEVPACRTLSSSPSFRFSNIPANTKLVSMTLTQGQREYGGQEISFPPTGIIPAGAITMAGPCSPGIYRWTAKLKTPLGETIAIVHSDRRFPE